MDKVKIYTWADKTPELLYKQYETIKKFVKDPEWEFIVFNNVPFFKFDRQKEIKKFCKENNVKCLNVAFRTFVSGASYITAYGINYGFHRYFRWEKDTIHVLIDSDMFLTHDISFNEYLGDNDICGIHQHRGGVEFLWNGILIFRGAKLPDKNYFSMSIYKTKTQRTDTGGKLFKWLLRNPDLKIRYIKHTFHIKGDRKAVLPERFRANYDDEYSIQAIEDFILHYRAGSNWQKKGLDFITAKRDYFFPLLNAILYENEKLNLDERYYIIQDTGE